MIAAIQEVSLIPITWDMRHVVSYLLFQGHDPAFVHGAVIEYLKYHQMLKVAPKCHLPVCSRVDVVWHAHILFTEDYTAFCRHVHGTFRHHVPVASVAECLALEYDYEYSTLPLYHELFGNPPDGFWQSKQQVCMGGDGDGGD